MSIDARPFLKAMGQTGTASQKGPEFDLELKSPILTGYSKQALTNVDLKMTRRGSAIRPASVPRSRCARRARQRRACALRRPASALPRPRRRALALAAGLLFRGSWGAEYVLRLSLLHI